MHLKLLYLMAYKTRFKSPAVTSKLEQQYLIFPIRPPLIFQVDFRVTACLLGQGQKFRAESLGFVLASLIDDSYLGPSPESPVQFL